MIWLTWERQRRNAALADAFGARYVEINHLHRGRAARYVRSLAPTGRALLAERHDVVFAQSPSVVLAATAAAARRARRFVLVIDAHNGPLELADDGPQPLRALVRASFRSADFVIVTNEDLVPIVASCGSEALVLPDRLPHIAEASRPDWMAPGLRDGGEEPAITLISSFAEDEPTEAFLAAAAEVDGAFRMYVTGKRARAGAALRFESERVRFTDYLPEHEFDGLLRHSDLAVDLTTRPDCLVCGAYEAVSVGVPPLLSDTPASRRTFEGGALFAPNDARGYRETLRAFLVDPGRYRDQVGAFRATFEDDWDRRFRNARAAIERRVEALRSKK